MNYDEKVFKEKANKKARRIWMVLYKNRKFMIHCGIANVLGVIVSDVYRGVVT